VIGHNESLSSPYHKELYKPWAHQTHADWKHADMESTGESFAPFCAPTGNVRLRGMPRYLIVRSSTSTRRRCLRSAAARAS
jgi:hypothetical protein